MSDTQIEQKAPTVDRVIDEHRRRRAVGVLLVAVVATATAIGVRHLGVVRSVEQQTVDLRFSIRGRQAPRRDVTIVALDANSLAHLPRFPFSRTFHAKVIDRLHAAGARLIVYDFSFDRPTVPSADDALATAATRAAPVVFATTLISHGQTLVLGGNANLRSFGDYPAASLLPVDSDGTIRHITARVNGLGTIATVVGRLITGHTITPRKVDDTGAWLDYAGPGDTYPRISFLSVLHGNFDPASVRGRIVLVGATAPILQDLHPTSAGLMSGAEVQANAIATVLDGLPLRSPAAWLDDLLLVLGVIAISVSAVWLDSLWVGVVGAATIVAWCVATQLAFNAGTMVEFTAELIGLGLATAGALAVSALDGSRERRELRELFAAASPTVVADVLEDRPRGRLPATGIVAGYRMEKLLAQGGMGVIYRATQLELGRQVAIKLIRPEHAQDPEYRARFERECRAAAAVEHANVIPVYEAGEDAGLLFIAMRLVNGVDLRHLLERSGPLEPARAARIVEGIAGALDAAHSQGVIHRDVKPANVLVTLDEPEHVYLTDFGVAKRLDAADQLTREGLVGTLDYVAPEQIQGEAVDGRADVYALAGVLYHCLTGVPPYQRDTAAGMLWAHVNAPPPLARSLTPELPEAIDAVIARGLAKAPAERYQSDAELAHDAAVALGTTSTLTAVDQLPSPAPPVSPTAPDKAAAPAVAAPDDPTLPG